MSEIRRIKMSIEIKHALRKPLSRAVFCLLILLPMGAVMAASKSAVQSNPFMQNRAQADQTGAHTTQSGVVTQGSLVAPAVQGATAIGNASTTSNSGKTSTKNATTTHGTSQQNGGGGL